MASIVLSAAGQAALPGIGGTVLGALGRYAGGLADQKLGLTGGRKLAGPRLDNLKVQDSRYGAGIPVIYGKARVAGQVIWASGLTETAHEEQAGGKGGGSVSATRYSYSVDCAVAFGVGPLARLAAAWADGKQIYDGLNWKSGLAASVQFYPGDSAQNPDPVMVAALGADDVPAYRGIAYIVFETLQLGDFGNRLPNLTFEIAAVDAAAAPEAGIHAAPNIHNIDTGMGTQGGTKPLIVNGDLRRTNQIAIIGLENAEAPAADAAFTAVTYDVTGGSPAEIARAGSAAFTTDEALGGISWALSPDGRYAAIVAITAAVPVTLASIAVYDIQARQFGDVLQFNLRNTVKSVAWLDALRFVISDDDGSALGVQIFTRAGLNVAALGFHGVWGAGSASSRHTIGTAQWLPLQGGLLYVTGNAGISPSALYGCHLVWDNGAVRSGAPYLISNAVPAFSFDQADILSAGGGEFIVGFNKTGSMTLMSFVPALDSAAITRNWQSLTYSFSSPYTAPCWFNGRIFVIQKPSVEFAHRMTEITLTDSAFALTTDSALVTGELPLGGPYYLPVALDANRVLVQGGANSGLLLGELRIISRYAGGDSLANIAGDLLARAGYAPGDSALGALAAINLTGYVVQPPVTARAALEPLRVFGGFDLIESDDKLKAVLRHDDLAAEIPDGELRASKDARQQPPPLAVRRAQELDLPREITVDYLDPARDFEAGSQRARRLAARATARVKIALPVVCSADQAKQIAERRLYAAWAERERSTLSLSRRYLFLDPGDVVQTAGRRLRLTGSHQSGGLLHMEAVDHFQPANSSAATGDAGAVRPAASAAQFSILYLMDLPPLRAEDDQPGIYAAVSGAPGWRGASLWRAADGIDYRLIDNFTGAVVAGMALTALASSAPEMIDRAHSVDVQLLQGTLAGCGDLDLLNGANAALLGGEIIQFRAATLLGPGHYRLSNLLRGRRGTETGIGVHMAGENFVLLDRRAVKFLPLPASGRERTHHYRALVSGQSLGDTPDFAVTNILRTLQPLAPVHLQGTRSAGAGSDLALSWIRRARLNAEWADHIDVPLDETQELYDLEILDGGDVVRTVSGLTAPAYLYTAAQQSADFTIIPASYDVRVYQCSPRYGRGAAANAAV